MQISKFLTSISLATLGSTALTLMNADNAQAIIFSFDGSDDDLSTIIKTVDGVTLTVSAPSPNATFSADSDGVCILGSALRSGFCEGIDSFDLTFSSSVQLISYNLDFVAALDGNETMTLSDGISTSVENSPFTTGSRNFANQFTVAANQAISVTNSGNNDGSEILQVSQIEVELSATPVPFEVSPTLGLLTIGGIWGVSRLRKNMKASKFTEDISA